MNYSLLASALLCSLFSFSQEIKLEEIMKGEDFIGHSPVNPEWSADGKKIRFDWNPGNDPGNSLCEYDPATKKVTKTDRGRSIIPAWNAESHEQFIYYTENGALMQYETKSGISKVIYSVESGVWNIQRTADAASVYFQQGGNLFGFHPETGIQQVTHFTKKAADPTKDTTDLQRQQMELFGYIRQQKSTRDWTKSEFPERAFPKEISYSANERLDNLTISKDERFVTFILLSNEEEENTFVEKFITEDGFTQRMNARSKVRNEEPELRFGIYDRKTDTSYFVSFSGLPDIRKRPAYFTEYGKTSDFEKDRSLYCQRPVMHSTERTAVMDIRSRDNKDRWIVLLNLEKGTVTELEHQHDEAWIGGPGISEYNESAGTLGWLDNSTIFFQSEESGYSHLYTLNVRTKAKTALTSGKFEIYDAQLSRDKQKLYVIANKIHPGVRNGYALSIKDKKLTPLFEGTFGIEWQLSPDEKMWAIRYSTQTQPWSLFIAENKPNARMVSITTVSSPAYNNLKIKEPQIIQIPTSGGKEVTARLYLPEKPNGAAVEFIHGAGYLQNAHFYWSTYYREFLFHQLLLTKGYTVIDVDYRGSEGYGRDCRTAIYRHMGEPELRDYLAAKELLVKKYAIDSTRVGIYGGSYGGFMTLMALLKTPGEFACGAALRSVTDWQHYNHEYTSNILNYPGTDPVAYKRSSPVYFAEGLRDPLLILHGMVDDNVQFQDVVRLNQRFIELGKTTYNMAVFPTEAHGFKTPEAWTDEYRRILELFEKELN